MAELTLNGVTYFEVGQVITQDEAFVYDPVQAPEELDPQAFSTGKSVTVDLGRSPWAPTDAEIFSQETVDDLAETRRQIMQRGWIQGVLVGYFGVCLLGGLAAAQPVLRRQRAASVALQRYLTRKGWRYSVAQWNDADGRTVGEVLDVVEQAAAWVKGKIND